MFGHASVASIMKYNYFKKYVQSSSTGEILIPIFISVDMHWSNFRSSNTKLEKLFDVGST